MPAIAFEEGTLFNCKPRVKDIPYDVACGGELNFSGTDTALDTAPNGCLFGVEVPENPAALTDGDISRSADIPIHLAVYRDIGGGDQCPPYGHVGADDRECFGHALAPARL